MFRDPTYATTSFGENLGTYDVTVQHEPIYGVFTNVETITCNVLRSINHVVSDCIVAIL